MCVSLHYVFEFQRVNINLFLNYFQKHTIKYLRVLEVISFLNYNLKFKSGVGRKKINIVVLSLSAEFITIDSENTLFKEGRKQQIPNLIN